MAGSLFNPPRFAALDASGRALPGAKLWFYQAGTDTLVPVYQDGNLTVPHANPVIANGAGWFPAIYLDPAAGYNFRVVLQNAAGVQIWAEDNLPALSFVNFDGPPGPTGGDGLSVAEVAIYLRSDTTPATPTGGSFNFANQLLTPPVGWSADVPTGNSPCWTSRAVAATEGIGEDTTLTWSAPVRIFADGSAVDIVFTRSASQPSTPAPSSGTPSGWYSDVASVPASSNPLWSSVGTRAHAGDPWVWQLPIKVEGDVGPQGPTGSQGPTGPSPTVYYISPRSGTAIKNSSGTLEVQARMLSGGVDSLLSSGTIKLYVGSTLVTVANGFATGSDGYKGFFDSGDISGSVVVTLKDGAGGTPLDTITLVDIADGASGTASDAVYGYVQADGPLAWVRGTDQSTWTPSGTTRHLDCTFVQTATDVARIRWTITRDSSGVLTGAVGTHAGGDLNTSRVTVTELGEGTQVMGVRFAYSHLGDVSQVTETVYTSLSGAQGSAGPGSLRITLNKPALVVQEYSNGGIVNHDDAFGQATVWDGYTDVTASATLSSVATGCTGAVNTATDTPKNGQPKGYYEVTLLSATSGRLAISATYGGNTVTVNVPITRNQVGIEILASAPGTNLFEGRVYYNSTDNKLYRYDGSQWTAAVAAVDLTGQVGTSQIAAGSITSNLLAANSVTANAILAGQVTAAKIAVTSLSSLTANLGTVTAGVLQNSSGGAKFDASNSRIMFNTAPGTTGGYVRISGVGFGPGNAYIDWYGAKPAGQSTDSGIISSLTDAGAKAYIKTNGEAVFAGRTRGEFEPKAWCCIYGEGTPTFRDRYNFGSISKLGTGRYRLNFATALPNANYAAVASGSDPNKIVVLTVAAQATTYVDINTNKRGDGDFIDISILNVIVFGSNVPGGSNVNQTTPIYGGGTIGGGYIP